MTKRSIKVRFFNRLFIIMSKIKRLYRKSFYKLRGAKIGNNVYLGKVTIEMPEQVIINDDCQIENNVRLRPGGPWKKSSIIISNNTFIGDSTQINVGSEFKIGSNCMIAPACIFSDAQHSFGNLDIPMKKQKCNYNPITVEDDVWIGTGVIILSGVVIGKGSIVAAGSVVNKSIPQYEIWGGIPAKKIKNRKN